MTRISETPADPWDKDRLGYRATGDTFTRLIQTIDKPTVLSIEAGFGRGKTFFRQAWAAHLRQAGERVIEIDAQQSDHSGDPVVTFLGALMAELPESDQSQFLKLWAGSKKLFWGTARIGANVIARQAGEAAIDAMEGALSANGEVSPMDAVIAEFGKEASKALSAQITAQLSAEQVRTQEMPAQMDSLREKLTHGYASDRIIILIDELDRCHPDYAIALLEAMKLVFNQPGFVFCLMANPSYLETLAATRFGNSDEGERYLDKFVDIRLRLPVTDEAMAQAASEMVADLPLERPLGDPQEFGIPRAAQVAAAMAPPSGLSMRQVKRVMLRLDLVCRIYRDSAIDLPLLVWLAFRDEMTATPPKDDLQQLSWNRRRTNVVKAAALGRTNLTREEANKFEDRLERANTKKRDEIFKEINQFIGRTCPELLSVARQNATEEGQRSSSYNSFGLLADFAPTYIPRHEAMLNAIAAIDGSGGQHGMATD